MDYPDSTQDLSGSPCASSPGPDMAGITGEEAAWLSADVVAAISKAIRDVVARHQDGRTRWHFVKGVTQAMARRGWCADAQLNYRPGGAVNRCLNTPLDSMVRQSRPGGCDPAYAIKQFLSDPTIVQRMTLEQYFAATFPGCDVSGTAHPNEPGYQAYVDPIVAALAPQFERPLAPEGLRVDSMDEQSIFLRWTNIAVNDQVLYAEYRTTNSGWTDAPFIWGTSSWRVPATIGETYSF
jgi:hypothetical protein